MTINQTVQQLEQQYEVLAITDLSAWSADYESSQTWLTNRLAEIYRSEYLPNQRLVFVHNNDWFDDKPVGFVLRNLQVLLNEIDISNAFVVVVSSQEDLESDSLAKYSTDPVLVNIVTVEDEFRRNTIKQAPTSKKEIYQYGSANPIKIGLDELSDRERFLLTESKTFCMYPWIHMHAWPTGDAYPCCHANWQPKFGNTRTETLVEVWNSDQYKQLRSNMLADKPHSSCTKCYEQEEAGFFSGRQSANKHHGHHVNRIHGTRNDGHLDQFEMTYWDIRFSNLCNLRCRSCGHPFSSQWYQDQSKLADAEWKKNNTVLHYAGRTETDMWEQLLPHIDHVETIYFAGGEPLLMEEHYNILNELVKRRRFEVRLIYNTNFTHTDLKGNSVFNYWNQFKSVAVGASLDAQGARAEYIRKGTEWDTVVRNREEMMRICPQVDFYINPTLSIMNALHLPDFHRDWVDRGFLKPQDLNVNILQDPVHYRIDIAPESYKQEIKAKFEEHLEWLRPQDHLRRATVGFESAINYMMATDNSRLIPVFWAKTAQLDEIRRENILDVIPELTALK